MMSLDRELLAERIADAIMIDTAHADRSLTFEEIYEIVKEKIDEFDEETGY